MSRVPFTNLRATYERMGPELKGAAERVLASGQLIGGPEVAAFESEFAAYLDVPHAIGVGNGTDALALALRAIGVEAGAEVIVPAVSAYPTCVGVLQAGATPAFVDVNAETGLIDPSQLGLALTGRTQAILPVHLFGQACALDAVSNFATQRGLKIVEDCAQAHGARDRGRSVGQRGMAAAWSFYPTKNLGAFGDAGAVTTGSLEVAERVRRLRNYGQRNRYEHVELGFNSRLDPLQAALLRVRLHRLRADNERRVAIAARYEVAFREAHSFQIVAGGAGETSSHHLYPIILAEPGTRAAFQEHLQGRGIETLIHYPIPMPLQEASKPEWSGGRAFPGAKRFCSSVVSLPIYPELESWQVDAVIEATLEWDRRP